MILSTKSVYCTVILNSVEAFWTDALAGLKLVLNVLGFIFFFSSKAKLCTFLLLRDIVLKGKK